MKYDLYILFKYLEMKNFLLSFFLILFFIIPISYSSPRFSNDEQLRKHHSHSSFLDLKTIPEKPINVHLIPHSHDDVGWLKTVDDYYYGNHMEIQDAQVQYIIDTVVEELAQDPSKTFIYVEIAFFKRWWDQQNDHTKDKIRTLIKNGQFEFINAGWCMNDEAAPYFEDIIDQMTLGHQFIKENFNQTTNIGWHIDPFGHSSSQASIFSQMGFDAFFFARIDYQDKEQRAEKKTHEMLWKPRQSFSEKKNNYDIFSIVNYYHYEAPPGFCFDERCRDDPIMDNPNLENYNLKEKAEEFVKYFKNMALHYKHNELIHTMGSDFQYSNAHKYFKNMDKLINYIQEKPEYGVNVFYSTPSRYVATLNKLNLKWPTKKDDFFPYADGDNAFWTGYFVSRASLKGNFFVVLFFINFRVYSGIWSLFAINKDTICIDSTYK